MTRDERPRSRPGAAFESTLSRRALLRRGALVGFGASLFGLLAACGGGSGAPAAGPSGTTQAGSGGAAASLPPASAGAASTPAATPAAAPGATFTIEPARHKGGRVIEGAFADAKTVNPVLESDTASLRIVNLIFDPVMTADAATAAPKGELAKSWEISTDGLTYTFTLQDGVKWHDGQPLTAADVKFTYGLLMNKASKSPRTSELVARIKSIDAVDDRTVRVELLAPNAALLVANMSYGIVPQHVLKDVDPAALAQHDFSIGKKGVTIGTGPFMFEEWVKDDHVTLSKFAGYFRGEPNLDQYIRKVVPDATVIPQQLKTGEIDFGEFDESSVDDMQTSSTVNVSVYDTFSFTFYAYQLDPARSRVFQDKAVRQALLYALDRRTMIDAIRFGIGEVAIGTIPSLSWAYNPKGLTNTYPYDVNKAKQLLDQAGWKPGSDGIRLKEGQRLSFSVYTNSGNQVREQYVTVFQEAWKKIGAECSPKTEEWNAFLERITSTHDFDMFLVGFQWDVDPDQTAMWASDSYTGGFNMNRYANPQVDQLLKDALLTTDRAKRRDLYTQMQNLVLDDLPSPILDFPKQPAAVNKRVHNLIPNAVDTTFNAHQWWVEG